MKVKYKIETYKDESGEWRWKAKRNGRIVMDSAEGYKRESTMLKTVNHFIKAVQENSFMISK
jgi:uncharacterized protein YegP (UPF0339 family)